MPSDLPVVLVGPSASRLTRDLLAHPDVAGVLDPVAEVRISRAAAGSKMFLNELAEADCLILEGMFETAWLTHRPRLRLVSVPATGYPSYVDASALAGCGVQVAYVPSYGTVAVAEHTLALVLAAAKNVVAGDRAVRRGDWPQSKSMQLAGRTAGVVGLGPIGLRMAGHFESLGMRVLVWTRHADSSRLNGTSAEFVDLAELFASSDVITLHLALTEETRGMIDDEMLGLTRPGTVLVNTARAALIKPGALERAASGGRLRAAVDVLTEEPPSARLLASIPEEQVVTPHTAYLTDDAVLALMVATAENVRGFLLGERVTLAYV